MPSKAAIRGEMPVHRLKQMQARKAKVVRQNNEGILYLFKKNKIAFYSGSARFAGGSSVGSPVGSSVGSSSGAEGWTIERWMAHLLAILEKAGTTLPPRPVLICVTVKIMFGSSLPRAPS